jgi:alkanesulfonate monooxygenase SsuD/methylene tetrahydromethanopterin reductase-like flavin-dependent oxidoreductase (luciferase family)
LFAGLGPGSSKGDYDACGVPFEDRWKRFSEALEVIHALWNEKDEPDSQPLDYEGKYYKLRGASIQPKPYQKPHPPIMIASWGSEQGLRRVAKYGDGWMASAYNITPAKFREKWTLLLNYRREMNKDMEQFENSLMTMFGYIDNDKEMVQSMVQKVLSPALGRSADELNNLLLFGSSDECIKKISLLYESGVKRIHFWPINNYLQQIEIFFKEIVKNFR